jgi:hypothetical protein
MNLFNENLCHSIKSKCCLNEQCSNKPKQNEILCGKHINSKNIIYFVNINTHNNNIINNNIINNDIINNDIINNDIINNDINTKNIYTTNELFDIITKNKYIDVYTLRKSIKNSYLYNYINTKNTKSKLIILIKEVMEKQRYYETNVYYIINIQKIYRKWLVYRKKKCSNDTDILTFNSIYDIPNKYLYIFNDECTNKKYAYDIRTLVQIINSNYPSCPYTFRDFTEIEKLNIHKHKNKLINYGISFEIEKLIMTPEEEIDMKIKDVFYQINMLDNYTNHIWFKNLNLSQLINLYIKMEDIWIYRTSMSTESRKNILYNGIAFNIPIYVIKLQKSLIKMQHILLDEFIRFITEGINRDEKKLGAILILTGLVEVSQDAAYALPHLIQI